MHSTNSITESKPYSVTPFPIYQSLHLLRKRDKNSTENFAQGAEKAVKSRVMLDRLKSVFPSGTGRKLAAVALPIFLTFSLASKSIAEEIKAPPNGTQIAMNTKAEGSGTNVAPASHTPAPKIKEPKPAGKFVTSDVRDYTGQDLIDAPYSFSTGRIAIILYGENSHVRGAVEYAAEKFAEKTGIMVSYLWAKDNDENPNNSRVGLYGGGRHHGDIDIGIERNQKEVALAVYKEMLNTFTAFRMDIERQQEILARQKGSSDSPSIQVN